MRCNAAIKFAIVSIFKATAFAAQDAPNDALWPRDNEGDNILVQRQQPGSHIESVISAAKSILSAAYPDGAIPTDLNVRTLQWEPVIDGTTYTPGPTRTPSPSESLTPTQSPTPTSIISTTSSRSTTTSETSTSSLSSTETSSTSSSATETSTKSASDTNLHLHNGDRAIAIALGIIISLLAVALAASILLLLWRRKRKTGQYFKPARCSECLTTPSSSAFGSRRSNAPWRHEPTEPTRSWFATRTNYLTPALADSAERLPEPVQKAYHRHQSSRLPDEEHPVYSHGPTRLQKHNSSGSRALPEIVDAAGVLRPHEVVGDDLTGMIEMDHDEPSRRAAEIGRLSAIPLIVHQMKELEAEYHNLSGSNGPSSSEDASQQPTELDAESPTRRTSGLWQFAANPFVVAQLEEAEGGYDIVSRDASNDSTRPSELDGGSVSPGSRRISSLMPFANNMVVAQLNSGEGEMEETEQNISRSTSDATSSDSLEPRRYSRHQPLVVMSSPAESETTPSTSPALLLPDSRSGSPADDEMSSVDGAAPPPPDFGGLRRTEVTMPDRHPSISSPDTSPMCERDQLLNRFRTPKISPVTPGSTKDHFLPAAGYASSPLWRKRRPTPVSPGSIPSPLSNASSDVTTASASRVPPGVRDGGPAAGYGTSAIWKKRRPLPISPGTPSPLPPVQDASAAEEEAELVELTSRRASVHPEILLPGRKSISDMGSSEQLRRDSQHPTILLPATTYHPPSQGTQSSQTLPHDSHRVRHGLPTPTSHRSKESLRNFSVTPPAQGFLSATRESLAPGGGLSIVPSWSEFDFGESVTSPQSNGERQGEEDGYRPVRESVAGRYELMT